MVVEGISVLQSASLTRFVFCVLSVLFPPANQVNGKSKYFAGAIENVTFDRIRLVGTSSGKCHGERHWEAD